MYAVLTHLPHLLQSFPSFSSLYYPFHKTSCVLLVTVPCPVIVPFCLCRPLHTLLPGTGGLVQLFIRCSQLKRCHSSTFSSLPEIKFPQCVQIPYFLAYACHRNWSSNTKVVTVAENMSIHITEKLTYRVSPGPSRYQGTGKICGAHMAVIRSSFLLWVARSKATF